VAQQAHRLRINRLERVGPDFQYGGTARLLDQTPADRQRNIPLRKLIFLM
jgi:hypothetical protein